MFGTSIIYANGCYFGIKWFKNSFSEIYNWPEFAILDVNLLEWPEANTIRLGMYITDIGNQVTEYLHKLIPMTQGWQTIQLGATIPSSADSVNEITLLLLISTGFEYCNPIYCGLKLQLNYLRFAYENGDTVLVDPFKYSMPTVVEQHLLSLPKKFSLSQSYPNPFNPVTKIKYSIPSVTLRRAQSDIRVSQKVYDILGREVATLVSEDKPAGEYEVEFNISNLSGGISTKGGYASGVYFYQLQAGDYIKTRKIVLIK